MSGFRRAVCQQGAVKMSMYGPPGSGKTFSALLFAEGIAKQIDKRIAYVDTELGTSFYAMPVPSRKPHPEAFDFDVIHTRSISEIDKEVRALDPKVHGIIVIDSISHLWDTAMASYSGPKTRAGTIPMHAWGPIKRPYKALVKFLIDSPFHVFILGRQANLFEEDEATGDTKAVGFKMRAEGETAYEPHICLRMILDRERKTGNQTITALAEKDRSGVLACKCIRWPTFETVIAPILGLMGSVQAALPSDDDAAVQDAESAQKSEAAKRQHSTECRERYVARFALAEDLDELKSLGKELTPAFKREFTAEDLAAVKIAWMSREAQLKGAKSAESIIREREPGEEGDE